MPPESTRLITLGTKAGPYPRAHRAQSSNLLISDGGLAVPIADVFFGHNVGVGAIYEDSNMKVTAIENAHFAFHRGPAAGKHKSYSYRFDREQIMINSGVWQAMTATAQNGILRQATEGHLSLADVGTMATRAGVKSVVLTHLTSRAGTDDYTDWVAEVRRHFAGPVLAAKDLMEF